MSLNTMSAPIRHPWFNPAVLKRKQPASVSDACSRSPKRRRSSTLERGFASLTLDAAMDPVVQEPVPPPPRPTTPVVPEITMKQSSWYEPEPDRIVITDLDSYSLSDDDDDADADATSNPTTHPPLISPALLEHLKSRPLASILPAPPQSQALVLFRPLVSVQPQPPAKEDQDAASQDAASDAMDVEP
ncbi:hypothetical protein C8R43DRAFT_1023869 [Mycena crocata]|nr:hypothetical protein C8R43DRAFT_1023869 [Mycena crocata]